MRLAKFRNMLWGSLFLAAAGVIVLHLLGLLGDMGVWTLLVSVPLVISIIYSLTRLEWAGTFYSTAALIFVHRHTIENAIGIRFHFWALFGIATLLTIGFYILFGKVTRVGKFAWSFERKFSMNSTEKNTETVDGDHLSFENTFGSSSKYIHSKNLSHIRIENTFGGMEIYFEDATLSPSGAVVEIANTFGGLELVVPKDWHVKADIESTFGGFDIPSKYTPAENAPQLILRGSSTFGGLSVRFV